MERQQDVRTKVTVAVLTLAAAAAACSDVASPITPTQSSLAPERSYSVSGWVNDTVSRRVEGATVQIVDGAQVGTTAVTDENGHFAFAQTFSSVPGMRASKAGYAQVGDAQIFTSLVEGTLTATASFRLGSLNAPVDFRGTYQLTFTADPACTDLPDAARARRYWTEIKVLDPSRRTLLLSGATFVSSAYSVIHMTSFDDFVSLAFGVSDELPIWETLDGGASVRLWGGASGTMTSQRSVLPVGGQFSYCESAANDQCIGGQSCQSSNHALTLVRQ